MHKKPSLVTPDCGMNGCSPRGAAAHYGQRLIPAPWAAATLLYEKNATKSAQGGATAVVALRHYSCATNALLQHRLCVARGTTVARSGLGCISSSYHHHQHRQEDDHHDHHLITSFTTLCFVLSSFPTTTQLKYINPFSASCHKFIWIVILRSFLIVLELPMISRL